MFTALNSRILSSRTIWRKFQLTRTSTSAMVATAMWSMSFSKRLPSTQGEKIREAVRPSSQHHDPQGPVRDVLLLREALVNGDERIEEPVHGVEELAVVEVTPTHFGRGPNFVARQALAKTLRHAGIEEHSHRGPLDSSGHCFG